MSLVIIPDGGSPTGPGNGDPTPSGDVQIVYVHSDPIPSDAVVSLQVFPVGDTALTGAPLQDAPGVRNSCGDYVFTVAPVQPTGDYPAQVTVTLGDGTVTTYPAGSVRYPLVGADVTRLRQLLADTTAPYRYSTLTLSAALGTAPRCKASCDGFDTDVYGVAADLWDDRAIAAEAAGDTEGGKVTSKRLGDAAVTYSGAGVGLGGMSAAQMRALAARLRKRSCNRPSAAKTVRLLGQNQRRHTLRDYGYDFYEDDLNGDGLLPCQVINGPLVGADY